MPSSSSTPFDPATYEFWVTAESSRRLWLLFAFFTVSFPVSFAITISRIAQRQPIGTLVPIMIGAVLISFWCARQAMRLHALATAGRVLIFGVRDDGLHTFAAGRSMTVPYAQVKKATRYSGRGSNSVSVAFEAGSDAARRGLARFDPTDTSTGSLTRADADALAALVNARAAAARSRPR